MAGSDLPLHTYEEIAEVYQQMGDGEQRDVFLVLAADAAFNSGYHEIAEQIRLRLLTLNPHHLFRPYTSFTEALQSADIQLYIEDLVRRFPAANAPQLLNDLRAKQHAAAARDLLFAQPIEGSVISDLRVFQQIEDASSPPKPGESSKRLPAANPSLPVNLAPPAPWLQERPLYDNGSETIMDPIGDQPEILGNWIALGLFVVAIALAAALIGSTFIFPFFH